MIMTKFNFQASLWFLTILESFLCNRGEASTAVEHIYHATKMDVYLDDCPFLEGRHIVWQEKDVKEIIAINGSIFSRNPKYRNFDVSLEGNKSILVIHNAEMEDSGLYSCHTQANNLKSFWLHMQTPPTLSVSVNGTIVDKLIDLDEHDVVKIECNATGADPPVSVSLAVDDKAITLDETFMDNDTHTAYASSRLIVMRSYREIICIDSGQMSEIYERSIHLNVMYPPSCILVEEDKMADTGKKFNCSCDANPKPIKYTFAVDGKIIQQSVNNKLPHDKVSHDATNVTCWADNGKDAFSEPAVYYLNSDPDNVFSVDAVIVIVSVVLIILVLIILVVAICAFVYKRKRKNRRMKMAGCV